MTHRTFGILGIGIIGTGRVARALALGLGGTQAPLIWGRSAAGLQDALRETGGQEATLARIAQDCDIIAIAVADDAIAAMVEQLAAQPFSRSPLVFHVSGGSGVAILEPLRACGARTAAIHPAMTFTGDPRREVERMASARFAVTAPDPEAEALALGVVDRLGGVAVPVPEQHRALYHAGLCHAANHLVTLIEGSAGALRAAGVTEPGELLAPLVRAALENVLSRGFAALSGPVLRGDAGTIAGHLSAIERRDPDLLPAYRAMARATLDELDRRAAPDFAGALRDVLDQPR